MPGYRFVHRPLIFLALLSLVIGALPASSTPRPPSAKIEPLLRETLTRGRADMIVHFAEQADLVPAYAMAWSDRGEFVLHALTQVALRSQARARDLLDRRGLAYRTFVAGNELYVWDGDLDAASALADLAEVASISAPRSYQVAPIVEATPGVPPGPDTLAWGITDTGAAAFWSTFGVQGDGIVVAGIDTGVQWNHPALDQSFKCGSDPADPACWYDPANVCGGSACDNVDHGTHTMGTMVADDDPALTWQAGMAPNASWIACKGCEDMDCSDFALSACADWILAPGGSTSNRPHVVNNSWGGSGGDPWYQYKVEAWRAAGIFPVFSAGNSGPGCDTIVSPGDYQESFAAAAHDASRGIADLSSRGPSDYGHGPYTKPNLSAPGVDVCSAVPGGGWGYGSGTSMASPHVAGAVALLWSCNPALVGQIDQTFRALQDAADTAPVGNCGAPPDGEGNYTYGYGYLNVLAAGQSYCPGGNTGQLSGKVTHAYYGHAIAGATVTVTPTGGYNGYQDITDAGGSYAFTLPAGSYDVTAWKGGHTDDAAVGLGVPIGGSTVQNLELGSAVIVVDPAGLQAYVTPGGQATLTLTIDNPGLDQLSVSIAETESAPGAAPSISIPASDGRFPRGDAPASAGPVSIEPAPDGAAPVQQPIIQGTMAYATEAANGFHTRFDLDAPDVLPNLGPFSALLHFPGAGEIVGGYVYVVDTANTLYQLDPDTGVVLSSGSITAPPNGETYAGMALDPTSGLVYASSTNLDTASLFIVDLNTGTATRIGPITGAACNIALAIDGSGQVYGYDVCTDDFWSIDKSTGAGTMIGSIGFDANYAQGMGWDPVSDQIYLAAFNNVSFQGELRLADRATGNTTLLGVLGSSDPGGTCHLPWLGIPGAAGVDVPWVSEEPASGAIPAGSDLDVSVILSAAPPYDALGDYSAGLTLWHNDPAVGAVTIPLTMTVLACLPIQRALLSWAPPMPLISETVTFYAQAIGGAPPYTFSWDLGDGYTGAGAIVTHTYTALGQYRVAMTATSACNAVVVERTLVVPSFVWEIYLPLLARGYSPGTATVPGWFWPRSIGGKL